MQNYHCHHSFSNVNTSFKDSAMSYEDYALRAVELGHHVITSVDHGTQGNYLRCWQTANRHGLKFVYGVEAYWVRNRHEQDRTNAHIIILAQTHNGILQINEMLSTANEDGYYHVPRIDLELLQKLNPADVLVTTACISFWGRVDKESQGVAFHYSDDGNPSDDTQMLEIFHVLHQHFGSSLMLEVQCHDTPWQQRINKICLKLHYQHKVPLIAGMDSHYIHPAQREERRYLREESGVRMDDEDHEFNEGVYEDYPDEETFTERFRKQGVLSEDEIAEAIGNTDVICLFDDIHFDQSRKLPTIYPELTQQERNQKYLDLIHEAWLKYRESVPRERWEEYEQSFYEEEANIVVDTNTSDYFLLDHEMVKLGVSRGGTITPSGRGSSGSWFTNTLLGLSTLDRFDLPVPLYPSRFCTRERLLTGMPDLDLNLGDPDIFAQAQEELLGKGHSYPMIAYGTLKHKSAFKLYARAMNLPTDEANIASKQIGDYEMALRNAEDDERDLIDIGDYVSSKYMKYVQASEPYRGIVVSKSQAPCAYLIYNGDIRSEIGIMRVNADGGKKVVYCTVIDGYTAEEFGYVKNDLLTVKVISINDEAMRRAGLPRYSSKEIVQLTKDDAATWDVLANGYTQGINQCQGVSTTEKLMLYKPRSLQDLTAFVAAIRPGFKSMVAKFLHRDKFDYGIPSFDALLKNDTTGSSWLLYQEDIMKCLIMAMFDAAETYPIIKSISKKKAKVINAVKGRFLETFAQHIMDAEGVAQEAARAVSEDVWQIIIDSSSYLFNAAHAVAVAIDALYGAYLKAHYPMAYYSALLDSYAEDGKKEKLALIKAEMKKAFGITVAPCRFGQDNRSFFVDHEHNQIADALASVKHIGKPVADDLYRIRNERFDSFVDLLCRLDDIRSVNSRAIDILIRMGYFEAFGSKGKLLRLYNEFSDGSNRITKQLRDASREKRIASLKQMEAELPDLDIPHIEQIAFEAEHYGTPISVFKDCKNQYAVLDVNTKYSPRISLYSITTGTTGSVKVLKRDFKDQPLAIGDVITVINHKRKPACSYVDGKRVQKDGVYELWLDLYRIDHKADSTNKKKKSSTQQEELNE